MNCGIVAPFCQVEIAVPLTRLVVSIIPEILLEGPVDHFCLTVRLRVVCSAHPQLSPAEAEEFLPKMAEEESVPVGYEASRKTMVFADHVDETNSDLVGGVSGRESTEMGSLGVTVHYNQDHSVAM